MDGDFDTPQTSVKRVVLQNVFAEHSQYAFSVGNKKG